MGKLHKNVFVLLGKDSRYKKIQLDKIKAVLLKEDPAITPISFYCRELDLPVLKQDLTNLSFSGRLFIFRNAEDMPQEIKEHLRQSLRDKGGKDFFVFDLDLDTAQREKLENDSFFSLIFSISPPYKLAGAQREHSLRDLAGAIRRNSQSESMRILGHLFERHSAQKISMQILGLMVRMSEQVRGSAARRRAFRDIFRCDRAIKEGMLDPQTALEILILRLIKKS